MYQLAFTVLLVAIAVGFTVLISAWMFSRSREMLEDWASSHGYRLVSASYCWWRRGPFFWSTSKNQTVYRITVADRDSGQTREAWARCGGFWFGVLAAQVDVRWDDA